MSDEAKIRKDLEESLGVEFLTPDEVDAEIEKVVEPAPDSTIKTITVGEIINKCREQWSKTSVSNPNKLLFYQCALALTYLVDRLEKFENPPQVH